MALTDTLITVLVILLLGFIIYNRAKKQSIRETIDEIREIFTKKPEVLNG